MRYVIQGFACTKYLQIHCQPTTSLFVAFVSFMYAYICSRILTCCMDTCNASCMDARNCSLRSIVGLFWVVDASRLLSSDSHSAHRGISTDFRICLQTGRLSLAATRAHTTLQETFQSRCTCIYDLSHTLLSVPTITWRLRMSQPSLEAGSRHTGRTPLTSPNIERNRADPRKMLLYKNL